MDDPLHREAKRVTLEEEVQEYHELAHHPMVQRWLMLHSRFMSLNGVEGDGVNCQACRALDNHQKSEGDLGPKKIAPT